MISQTASRSQQPSAHHVILIEHLSICGAEVCYHDLAPSRPAPLPQPKTGGGSLFIPTRRVNRWKVLMF